MRVSAATASAACALPARWVNQTFACFKSAATSTDVTVTMPTRGSLTSLRRISARSRWISSATLRLRGVVRCGMFVGAGGGEPRLPRPFPSERARGLDDLVHLELVALLHIVEVLDRQAALEARLHLAHVVLEALQRIELAVVDHDVVAQHADLRAAAHEALLHVAARDHADLRDPVDLAHLDQAE